MKIGYFITHYPNQNVKDLEECGGAERSTKRLAIGMASQGHEVKIFTTTLGKETISIDDGVEVHQYHSHLRILSSRFSLWQFLKPLFTEIDVVHAQFTVPFGFITGWFYSRIRKRPLVITHRSDLDPSFYQNQFFRLPVLLINILYKRMLQDAKCIVCPSKSFAQQSKVLHPFEEKIVAISNGIDVHNYSDLPERWICREKLGLSPDEVILLYVGTIAEYKGLDQLLYSLPLIRERYAKIRLIIIGAGPFKDSCGEIIANLNISSLVKLTGMIYERELLTTYYRAADVFVLPSRTESFGNVLLEAMACGVPVVASNTGGIPEIVKDGFNGILVQPDNFQTLAEGICKLIDNKELREMLIVHGLHTIKQFTWEKAIADTEDIYNKLV